MRPSCSPNGPPKLKSSMTLFYLVDGNPIFKAVLDKFFAGELDEVTADQLDK